MSAVADSPSDPVYGERSKPRAASAGSDDDRYGPQTHPDFDSGVVPPYHDRRTLVLCFDGTGDQFDGDNSNIVQFFSMLRKDNPGQQLVYYQAGIGTYTIPQIATPLTAKFKKMVDLAVAKDMDAHVMAGYEFLMQNYEARDKICIFGFSRGAYTARALAGMIHKVGLLPRCNHQQVPFAYKMFSRKDDEGWRQSTAFKKAFSNNVEVEFLGVWDTVVSVGLVPRTLPFTKANNSVRFFRHAVSLDEHRAKFKANHWRRTADDAVKGVANEEMPASNQADGPPRASKFYHKHHPQTSRFHGDKPKADMDDDDDDEPSNAHLERDYDDGAWETNVLEVWFAGCHCDIGGGSVPNGTRHSLARIPLRWMIRQCFLAGTGIQFHRSSFVSIGMDPANLYPFVVPRPAPIAATPAIVEQVNAMVAREAKAKHHEDGSPKDGHGHGHHEHHAHPGRAANLTGRTLSDEMRADYGAVVLEMSEEEEEVRDALCPVYDQLRLAWPWWLLEVVPLQQHVQRPDTSWVKQYSINMGKPRKIPRSTDKKEIVRVHRSVRLRMDADGLAAGKYTPHAKFPVAVTWED